MYNIQFFTKYLLIFLITGLMDGCITGSPDKSLNTNLSEQGVLDGQQAPAIRVGAEILEDYIPLLQNKQVGLVVNQTSVIGSEHLADTLLALNIKVKAIFAPEHGFRGKTERGKDIENGIDETLGIPVISIYGSKKKPTAGDLAGIDYIIFDIQDVGVRFFTYISTLHYVMEACAENGVKLIVLDRPNPLGHYIDGPVLDTAYCSFVGMHPVPVVYGMTIGEYALMINGEGWLKNQVKCDLHVVKVENYNHQVRYKVPVNPSPNLPDMKSVYLYPSICFFEGAEVNEGRGTDKPFQVFGYPTYIPKQYAYTPVSKPGLSLHPKFEGKECYGYDLSGTPIEELQQITQLELKYLIEFYNKSTDKKEFFNAEFFDLLAGGNHLRKQIISGTRVGEIRKSWEQGIENFKKIRSKYLLYE